MGLSSWRFSAIQTADMVPRKAAEAFPVAAKCTRCRERASARESSAARPTLLSCCAQANKVLCAKRRRAKALGSVVKSAARKW